jgi:hypothetical protein
MIINPAASIRFLTIRRCETTVRLSANTLAKIATEIVTRTQNITTERIYFQYLIAKTLYQRSGILSITTEKNPGEREVDNK